MPTERFPLVAEGVRILDPSVGPDTMAVVGAMMSRTPDLGLRFDQLAETAGAEWDFRNPPERVRAFLENNLGGYSHASIASMAKSCFIYVHGFGWPAAWLLTDSMLFDGQEVSTRAVDATRIPGVSGPGTICRYAPEHLQPLHDRWLSHYTDVKAAAGKSGWRFDDARVYLPGTVPTGVVLTNDVRSIARHLDHIRAYGPLGAAIAEQTYSGLDALAPVTTRSIGRKTRRALGQWHVGLEVADETDPDMAPGDGVSLVFADSFADGGDARDGKYWRPLLDSIEPRERFSTYMDPLWRQAPRIRFSVLCSLAIARDWHRHRPLMPWQMSVLAEPDGSPEGFRILTAPWYGIRQRTGDSLMTHTTRAFVASGGDLRNSPSERFAAMHALPFGTLVRLECTATLPDLVYMLELRMLTAGANPEYRDQARAALEQLCRLLPPSVVEAEHLKDGLEALEKRQAIHPV